MSGDAGSGPARTGGASGPHEAWDPGDLTGLEASGRELIRTVDGLSADDLAAPSLLPGWTRAYVVAHLALNGHALAGVLDGVAHGQNVATPGKPQIPRYEPTEGGHGARHPSAAPIVLRDGALRLLRTRSQDDLMLRSRRSRRLEA